MNIEIYIAQLLYRYQCVTIPGFGAFLSETQSAELDLYANTFSAPKKIISFNAILKNNDGLLANHIAMAEKTSYQYAVSAIEHGVLSWKNTLATLGYLELKNIGSFKLNSEGNLVFSACTQTNFLTNSFGLSTFVSPMIKRVLVEQISTAATASDVEVIDLETSYQTKPYLKYAAIFILGLGLAASMSYSYYEQYQANQTTMVQQLVQKRVQNKIQEATFFIKNPIPAVTFAVSKVVKAEKLSYHVMADAFRDERNASLALKKLLKQGFEARRIPKNKYGLYPVVYSSHATFAAAEKAKHEIEQTLNPDVWILIESL